LNAAAKTTGTAMTASEVNPSPVHDPCLKAIQIEPTIDTNDSRPIIPPEGMNNSSTAKVNPAANKIIAQTKGSIRP
jgi:hypothetical protein